MPAATARPASSRPPWKAAASSTRIVERAFDEHFHPVAHASPARNEPTVALAGFDDITPRRLLGEAGFDHIVDAGLGAGPVEYLDMVMHTFPAPEDPRSAFSRAAAACPAAPRDRTKARSRASAKAGIDETAARCGMLDIAGVTVGAAFVGTFASTLVVADILRLLHGGEQLLRDLRRPAQPGWNPSRAEQRARRVPEPRHIPLPAEQPFRVLGRGPGVR